MSGDIYRNTDDSHILIGGATAHNKGAWLALFGQDAAEGGAFVLTARKNDTFKQLYGDVNDVLSWGGKNIEAVDSQGNGWIRYSSGLQICWFTANNINSGWQGYSNVSYPNTFANDDVIITFCNRTDVNVSTGMHEIRIAAKTPTHFWAYWLVDGAPTSEYIGGDFIAIGHWK